MNAALLHQEADAFAVLRAYHRMRLAGFRLRVDAGTLVIDSKSTLTDAQAAFIRAHKPALVALLADVATLSALLATAGAAGIAAGEPGWDWERRYVALDVLIANGHARFVLGRHYAAAHAPVIDWEDFEERAAIMEYDGGLDRNKAEQKALALAIRADAKEPQP